MSDPYGRAIRDSLRNERDVPLLERYGDEVHEHSQLDSVYFSDFGERDEDSEWIVSWLDGPLLDIGAGTGRHALYFQDRFETVAIDVSEHLVEVMRERGVRDARRIDMFDLHAEFERDRFSSVLMIGTQLGLTASSRGLRQFLDDVAAVTTADGTAVIDSYHPAKAVRSGVPGFRSNPERGVAHRVQQFEYESDTSEPLFFRFVDPDRLQAALTGTGWVISDSRCHPSDRQNAVQYRVALTKR